MALLNLIFKNFPTNAVIGTMELDASISESHQFSSIITDNEIETGEMVQDHVKLQPITLIIDGIISDNPLTTFNAFTGTAVSAGGQIVNDAGGGLLLGSAAAIGIGSQASNIGSFAGLVQKKPRTPKECYLYLEGIWKLRQPFEVVTALQNYQNMVIQNLSMPRDSTVGRSLRFSATFRQIRKVKSETVNVPRFFADDPNVNPNKTVDQGKQSADVLNPEGNRASILKRTINAILGD